MICKPCQRGDHCGPPGIPGPCGTCQHYPPGTNQEQGQTAGGSRPEPSPVSQDSPAPAREPQRLTEDLDLPDPGPVAPGFREVLKSVPTITLVADWMRAVRAGHTGKAGVLQGLLAERFEGRRSR